MELYRKLRPTTLDQIYGQPAVVKQMAAMVKGEVPHVIMFCGPSGTGKSTSAKILRTHLDCGDHDFMEIDAATNRGIDDIRSIKDRMNLSPLSGTTRVWLLDEAHMLTREAQNALLLVLENPPPHVYFFISTTDEKKLLETVRSRCTVLKFSPVNAASMASLITDMAKAERIKVSEDVIEKIVECANGNARSAVTLLEKASRHKNEAEQLAAITAITEGSEGVINLCRLLIFGRKPTWSEVSSLLKTIEEEPETVRRAVLGYTSSVMLGGKELSKCASVINAFRDPYYDTGRAGLLLSCYEVVCTK